jgi:hypothetical protein
MSARSKSLSLFVALVFGVVLSAACGSPGTNSPTPGEWKATAEFGNFVFVVNPDGASISKVTYDFKGFKCGPVSRSGAVSVTFQDGKKIDKGALALELDMGGGAPAPMPPNPMAPSIPTKPVKQTLKITGKFSSDGKSASGDWTGTNGDSVCSSGKWEASPGK